MELLAIVLIVSSMILIVWLMMTPAMVQVLFIRSTGEHDYMTARPSRLPGGVLVVLAKVPEELFDVTVVGCVITIVSFNRVLDITFEEPVQLCGEVEVIIDSDGDGHISFSKCGSDATVKCF